MVKKYSNLVYSIILTLSYVALSALTMFLTYKNDPDTINLSFDGPVASVMIFASLVFVFFFNSWLRAKVVKKMSEVLENKKLFLFIEMIVVPLSLAAYVISSMGMIFSGVILMLITLVGIASGIGLVFLNFFANRLLKEKASRIYYVSDDSKKAKYGRIVN